MKTQIKNIFKKLNAKLEKRRTRIRRYVEYKRLKRVRKYHIPQYNNCKNCGAKLSGMYCSNCGQYALDVNQPFHKYVKQFFENTYQFDGKVFQTLYFLIIKPGFLSKEFICGKINSYVHPLRLYMFVSVIFFTFVITVYSNESVSKKVMDNIGKIQNKADTLVVAPSINELKNGDELISLTQTIQQTIQDSIINNVKKGKNIESWSMDKPDGTNADSIMLSVFGPEDTAVDTTVDDDVQFLKIIANKNSTEKSLIYQHAFSVATKYSPLLLLLLMPIYGAILKLVYRKKCKNYMHNFVFALHVHTLLILILSLLIITTSFMNFNPSAVLFSLLGVYILLASKYFYNNGWIKTFIKTILSLLFYLFIVFLCVSVLAIFILMDVYEIAGGSF